MSGRRDDGLLILDMIEAAEHLLDVGRRTLPGSRHSEPDVSRAILFDLVVLGEAAKRVSAGTREGNPAVPWRRIAETRDRIVHHYEGVDWAIVDSIIEFELAALVGALRSALVSLPTEPTRP
jgi:uncharacterized protein with HEPN domain